MLWAVPLKYSCSKHLLALKLLKAICYFSDQTTNLLRSLWSTSALLTMLTTPYRTLSSANSPNSEVIWRRMSLMYIRTLVVPGRCHVELLMLQSLERTVYQQQQLSEFFRKARILSIWSACFESEILNKWQQVFHNVLWKWDSEQVTTSFSYIIHIC